MEPAGDLVGVFVELAAGVQRGHHHFERRAVLGGMHPDGDAASVVGHLHRPILVDDGLDPVAIARHRLVDGVVDDLVDEMVQAAHAHVADVHGRALSDGLHAFQHLNVRRAILGTVLLNLIAHSRSV